MRTATENDRERIIEILVTAFEKNLSVNAICMKTGQRQVRITKLMNYAIRMCSTYGKVWITKDRNACALVLFPDQKRFSFRTLYWGLKLVGGVIGLANIWKVIAKEAKIKRHHPKTPFYHLWFIGVHAVHKGLGIGSELMEKLIADA